MIRYYYVIFSGEIEEGYDIATVKRELGALIEEDDETIEHFFSGQSFVIKKDTNRQQCEQIQALFLSVGAVCHIRDVGDETGGTGEAEPTGPKKILSRVRRSTASQEPASSVKASASTASLEKKEKDNSSASREQKQAASDKTGAGKKAVQKFGSLKSFFAHHWSAGSASMQSDMEIDGLRALAKNRYFQIIAGTALLLICVMIVAVNYERKDMPIKDATLNQVVEHITFIHKAFTPEEILNLKNNPADFLDYMLRDPIEKMGYQFEESIDSLVNHYLKNKLTQTQVENLQPLFTILVRDRDSLRRYNMISEELHVKLDQVALRMGQ